MSLVPQAPSVIFARPPDPYEHLWEAKYKYEGGYDELGRPHGRNATIKFENGDIFRGHMLNGSRNGYGILTLNPKKQCLRCVT